MVWLAAINCSNFSASIPGNRGTILYLNGRGCLCRESAPCLGTRKGQCLSCATHIAIPFENLGSTGISIPFSSKGFKILNTANTLAMAIHTVVSAMCLPAQMRRPNPNAMCSVSFGLSEPSSLRNRSGMNVCGLGYLVSSCAIALARDHQNLVRKNVEKLTTGLLRGEHLKHAINKRLVVQGIATHYPLECGTHHTCPHPWQYEELLRDSIAVTNQRAK